MRSSLVWTGSGAVEVRPHAVSASLKITERLETAIDHLDHGFYDHPLMTGG